MATQSRTVKGLLLLANSDEASLINVPVIDEQSDEPYRNDVWFTYPDREFVKKQFKTMERVSSTMMLGIQQKPIKPTFRCYHLDFFGDAPVNTIVHNWQIGALGRPGFPWRGHLLVLKDVDEFEGLRGEMLEDFAVIDIDLVKRWFCDYGC
jgi:hypothetical protein